MATLHKIAADEAVGDGLRCSFCGKAPAGGSDLIAGRDAWICDECVATCNELIATEDDAGGGPDDPGDEEAAEVREPPFTRTFFRLLPEVVEGERP